MALLLTNAPHWVQIQITGKGIRTPLLLSGIAQKPMNSHTVTVGTRLSLAKHDGLRLLAMANDTNVSDLLRTLIDAALADTTPTLVAPTPAPTAPAPDLSDLVATMDAMRVELANLRAVVSELRVPAPAAPLTIAIPQLDGLNALATQHADAAAAAAAAATPPLRQRVRTALFDYATEHDRRCPANRSRLTFRGDVAVFWHRKLNATALLHTLAADVGCTVDDVRRFVVIDHHRNAGDCAITALLPSAAVELLPPAGG